MNFRPEEDVRQWLLKEMVEKLFFPPSLIAVEKDLKDIPHLREVNFQAAKRRADIIVFCADIHPIYPLYPLLLVECKADKLDKAAINQVLGYNHFVKAFFVALAGGTAIKTFWHSGKRVECLDFLPAYHDLLKGAQVAVGKA